MLQNLADDRSIAPQQGQVVWRGIDVPLSPKVKCQVGQTVHIVTVVQYR